ncbi:MAG: hypothetical protein ABJL33_15370 [Hyphomicrobiales bacterium]
MSNAPQHPANIAAARELISDANLAARTPFSVLETAWQILRDTQAAEKQVTS